MKIKQSIVILYHPKEMYYLVKAICGSTCRNYTTFFQFLLSDQSQADCGPVFCFAAKEWKV